jgi:hypothetical protein
MININVKHLVNEDELYFLNANYTAAEEADIYDVYEMIFQALKAETYEEYTILNGMYNYALKKAFERDIALEEE